MPEEIGRGDSCPQYGAEPLVAAEGAQAALGGAWTGIPELPAGERRRNQQGADVRPAEFSLPTHEDHAEEKSGMANTHGHEIELAEEDGGGFGSCLQIVLAIGHRVEGVVGHHPEQHRDEAKPRKLRHLAEHRGKAHRHRPGEGRAQAHLREMGDALEVGIAGGQEHRRHAEQHRQAIGEKDQSEGQERAPREEHERCPRREHPCCERAVAGAGHLRIEPAIGVIVDRTSGRPHQDYPEGEDDEDPRRRQSLSREPKPPPGRPEQKHRPHRPVHAREQEIGPQPSRGTIDEPRPKPARVLRQRTARRFHARHAVPTHLVCRSRNGRPALFSNRALRSEAWMAPPGRSGRSDAFAQAPRGVFGLGSRSASTRSAVDARSF